MERSNPNQRGRKMEDRAPRRLKGEALKRLDRTPSRIGWAEASKALAAVGEDELVWPDFPNEADADWTW